MLGEMIGCEKSNFYHPLIIIQAYTLQTPTFALNNCDFIFFTKYKALHHIISSVLTQENPSVFIGGWVWSDLYIGY